MPRPPLPGRQSSLGLVNYYQRFIPYFAARVTPLTDLLAGGGKASQTISLSPTAIKAFLDIKNTLCQQTALHTPLENVPFIVHTDASSTGLEAVLFQLTPQGERLFEQEFNPYQEKICCHRKGSFSH